MPRAVIILNNDDQRARAKRWVDQAPRGSRVEISASRRTTAQNSRLWAMLTEVAVQKDWHGVRLTPDDWKLIFMAALNHEMRIVPNLDGTGFVNLGSSTSRLTKEELTDLMEVVGAWGSANGVTFNDRGI